MSKWSIPLDRLAAKSKQSIDRVGRTATFQLFNAVQLRSPVDTGRFRGNWQFGKDAIPSGTVPTTDASGALANQQALRALTAPVGGIVYFANNLPYARRLEDGYSRQAPQGMVRLSVIEFRDYVRAAI
jgi:hypothetical protein